MSFFELSKILGALAEPLNTILLLLLVATLLLWRGRARAGRWLLTATVAVLSLIMVLPISNLLLTPLEQRFPQLDPLPAKVDGIVMLGGAQQPRLTRAYGQPAMNDHAERMTTFLALARRYPEARLLFSGGSGDIRHPEAGEADTVRLFLEQQGFDASRVQYESRSRNTYENALYSKALVKPQANETWLLVASAGDVPRSIGVFRAVGWQVTPFPCDYNALPLEWTPSFSLLDSLKGVDYALHEWIGLLAYYLTGKSSSIFPAPNQENAAPK